MDVRNVPNVTYSPSTITAITGSCCCRESLVSFRFVWFFFTTFELTSGIGGRIGDLLEGIQIGGNCLNGSAVNIEKQTEIDDYNRETRERKSTKVAIDYGAIRGQ